MADILLAKGTDCKGRQWERIPTGQAKDWTGVKYKKLTYLFRIQNLGDAVKNHSWWLAECECGNLICVRSDQVCKVNYQSCGCYSKEKTKERFSKNLTNMRFGKLTAMYRVDNNKREVRWHCKCDCGNECDVQRAALTSGATKSCGCLISFMEETIEQVLKQNKINYKRQYRIADCKDKLPLPFDFAILEDEKLIGLIEYQGQQHYKKSSQWDDEETFKNRQNHDKVKREYCKQNNILLLIFDKANYSNEGLLKQIRSIKEHKNERNG